MRVATSASLLSLLAGGTLVIGGCHPRAEELVSVDLSVVARGEGQAFRPIGAPQRPPAPLPSVERTLPALPATTINPPKGVSKAELSAELERERQAAQEALAKRLRDSYLAEARAEELARFGEIESFRLQEAAEIVERLRARFEAYDAQRAPLVARLAFLVGFPDPGPRPNDDANEAARRRAAEAATIRPRLAALDREFDAFVASLQAEAEAELATQLALLREEIVISRRQIEARAVREAREQVARVAADLNLRLGGGEPVQLPAVPGRSVTLPASTPLPQVNLGSASPPDRLSERLRAELRIWSGLHRVRVVPAGPGVRDATAEFEKWRKPR